jgi:hypothetical protein
MATPLTVCLVVVGRHVERLKFLDVMLGDQPPLSPPQLVYQRMLAGDPLEAAEQAHDFLKEASLEDYCDAILLEGLRLAEADRRLGHLDEERLDRIVSTVDELVAHLEAHHGARAPGLSPPDMSSNPGAAIAIEQARAQRQLIEENSTSPRSVLCIPGSSKLDEAAALVLAYLLRQRDIGALAEETDALSMSKFFSLDMTDTSLACVCYVGQPSITKVQDVVRRLNKKNAEARVLLALFGTESATPSIGAAGATTASGSFRTSLEAIIQTISGHRGDATANSKDIKAS